MKKLLLVDGNGTELQVYSNHKDMATIKIYTDITGGSDNYQKIELDVHDIKQLIKELKTIHYDLK